MEDKIGKRKGALQWHWIIYSRNYRLEETFKQYVLFLYRQRFTACHSSLKRSVRFLSCLLRDSTLQEENNKTFNDVCCMVCVHMCVFVCCAVFMKVMKYSLIFMNGRHWDTEMSHVIHHRYKDITGAVRKCDALQRPSWLFIYTSMS